MGSTVGSCVLQVPTSCMKYIVGYIDQTIAPMNDVEKRRYSPSRCYISEKDSVLVWRSLPYQGPFWTDLCEFTERKSKEVGFEWFVQVYDLDEKVEGKVFRCIPEVPNAACVQYWQFKEVVRVLAAPTPADCEGLEDE